MKKPVISVNNISKRYLIDKEKQVEKIRYNLIDLLIFPYRMLRRKPAQNSNSTKTTIWALRDVCFDVFQGERVGIIGRNGAGKSTLLKILSRLVYPTSGEAIIRGRVNSLLEVGTGFNPNLTGRENIFFNASLHGLKRNEIVDRLDDIINFSEINAYIDTPVKFYSSGMYMRLAFSVAAHLDANILLLDEVLAVGDMAFQKKMSR